jgi:small basic protein
MSTIIKYMGPLWTFIIGMVLTLLMTIFFPAIFTSQQALASNAAVSSGAYWGLQEAITSTRLIIFLAGFFITLFLTATVWIKRKG